MSGHVAAGESERGREPGWRDSVRLDPSEPSFLTVHAGVLRHAEVHGTHVQIRATAGHAAQQPVMEHAGNRHGGLARAGGGAHEVEVLKGQRQGNPGFW
jgi:hypothetical protein